jgi:NAD(P)-dependent dehydrogenase (short-subunit alcohol dehydrogenase family)
MQKAIFDFVNKVAVVTGGSSGIGRETALGFARNGAAVVVSDIDEGLGSETARQITGLGGRAQFVGCDVSQESEIVRLMEQTKSRWGRLDFACNDAGIEGQQGVTTSCSTENFDRTVSVNLRGVWLSMKYEIPFMLETGGGAIVNVSSIAGLIGFPGLPAYVASKHGVNGLTKTAALEYAAKNVRVNSVCPGPIMTPMLQRLMDTTPGFTEQILAGVPERRIGTAAEVADTVLFLCSSHAAYITGQCLAIDGGWVAQ